MAPATAAAREQPASPAPFRSGLVTAAVYLLASVAVAVACSYLPRRLDATASRARRLKSDNAGAPPREQYSDCLVAPAGSVEEGGASAATRAATARAASLGEERRLADAVSRLRLALQAESAGTSLQVRDTRATAEAESALLEEMRFLLDAARGSRRLSEEVHLEVHENISIEPPAECSSTDGLNIESRSYPCTCGSIVCQEHQVCHKDDNLCLPQECPVMTDGMEREAVEFRCKCGVVVCEAGQLCDMTKDAKDACSLASEQATEQEEQAEQDEQEEQEEHGHAMPLLFFVLVTLGAGCVLQVVQERLLPAVPYTCMLFSMGFLMSIIHQFRPDKAALISAHQTWYFSIEAWENMNPHALFFTFLPALIFADAMKMNRKLIRKVFVQVFLLACPGVLIGTFATALFAKYVFPYEWPFKLCVLFGGITAATDPVAVVALFNTLGVSPRLTLLVSGESLMNDGTAIVMFQIALKALLNPDQGLLEILSQSNGARIDPTGDYPGKFIVSVIFVALVFGVLVALTGQVLIYNTAESKYHTDAMIQVTVSIIVAYMCFWFAEHELGASGVLAVVFAGGCFSVYSWPCFASKEAMHIVWEAIEFLGNTMIFTLGGLEFGAGVMSHHKNIEFHVLQDIGMLLLLYVASTAIRAGMILVLSPLMNCTGDPITLKEMIVMSWSGLRGAVAIVLAIMVDLVPDIDSRDRARFMFHIGGMAMLTTLVNAPLAKPLLQFLGMTKTPKDEHRANMHAEDESIRDIIKFYEQLRGVSDEDSRDERFFGHDEAELTHLVPYLEGEQVERFLTRANTLEFEDAGDRSEESDVDGEDEDDEDEDEDDDDAEQRREMRLESRVCLCRQVFSRMLQHLYWTFIEEGVLPKGSRVARRLIYSTQDELEDSDAPLHGWTDCLHHAVSREPWPILGRVVGTPPLSLLFFLKEMFPTVERARELKVRAALCYIQAHKIARRQVKDYFGDAGIFAEAEKKVFAESAEQCQAAHEALEDVSAEHRKSIQTKMLAGKLIHYHLHKIEGMHEEGLISTKGAQEIAHHLQRKYRTVTRISHMDVPTMMAMASAGEAHPAA